jgi:hypothetical protein
VNELGIGAYRNDFGTGFFEGCVLLCQSSKFSCSDKGKIRGIEEEDGPQLGSFLGGQADLAEISFGRFECFEFEIRDGLANPEAAAIII